MAPALGYWGEPTATTDWCESNYQVSYYVAEWWNTITNVAIIFPPIWGISQIINQNLDRRFIIGFILISVVGVGSWLFHMTLLYENQLLDELPMMYHASFMWYCWYEIKNPKNKIFLSNKPLFFMLLVLSVFFSISYLTVWTKPVVMFVSYSLLVHSSWLIQYAIVRKRQCKICKRLMTMSISVYCFAAVLWYIDKHFCSSLENLRPSLPFPARPLTQFHGLFHCLASFAVYLQMIFCIHSWHDFHKRKEEKRKLEVSDFGLSIYWSGAGAALQ